MNGIGLGLSRPVEQSSRVEELDDQWLSESTTSPDQQRSFEFSVEGTLGPPMLTPRSLSERAQQQDMWQDFWTFPTQASELSQSEDLYEQLQTFHGLESSALDRLFAGNCGWDGQGNSTASTPDVFLEIAGFR